MNGKIQFGVVFGGSAKTTVPPWIGVPLVGTPGGAAVPLVADDDDSALVALDCADAVAELEFDPGDEADAVAVPLFAAPALPQAASTIPATARMATNQRP